VAARRIFRLALALVAMAAVACGKPTLVGSQGPTGRPTAVPTVPDQVGQLGIAGPSDASDGPGVDLVPIHIPAFIFGYAFQDPAVQPGSRVLAGGVPVNDRLVVKALPSAGGTVAVDLLELSPPGHRWGERMIPAEREMFRSFASDRTLGDVLVIVDDVKVLRRPDPVQMTAYRWDRSAVESYAACGIPDQLIEACTDAFYMAAEMVVVGRGRPASGF
jgi:hypothetical protein